MTSHVLMNGTLTSAGLNLVKSACCLRLRYSQLMQKSVTEAAGTEKGKVDRTGYHAQVLSFLEQYLSR
jgi:hypothetical protein